MSQVIIEMEIYSQVSTSVHSRRENGVIIADAYWRTIVIFEMRISDGPNITYLFQRGCAVCVAKRTYFDSLSRPEVAWRGIEETRGAREAALNRTNHLVIMWEPMD